MSDEIMEMKEKIAHSLVYARSGLSFADLILSLETDTCRIAVVRKEGEMPDINPIQAEEYDNIWCHIDIVERLVGFGRKAMKDMLDAGYVQEA